MGVPVVIGASGVEKVVDDRADRRREGDARESAAAVRELIEAVPRSSEDGDDEDPRVPGQGDLRGSTASRCPRAFRRSPSTRREGRRQGADRRDRQRGRRRQGADPRGRSRQGRRRQGRQGRRRRGAAARREDPRHAARHAPDRPRGPEGPAPLRRAGPRHRARALPRRWSSTATAPRRRHGVDRGRHGDRGGRRTRRPRRSSSVHVDPVVGLARLPGARSSPSASGLDGKATVAKFAQAARRALRAASSRRTARCSRSTRWSSPRTARSSRSTPR